MSRLSVLKPPLPSSREKTGRHLLSSFANIVEIWLVRRHGRQELSSLGDEQLKDVGISREHVLREAGKPFWRP